jgi:hypothetical protein
VEMAGVGAAHVAEADKADCLSEQGRVHEMCQGMFNYSTRPRGGGGG